MLALNAAKIAAARVPIAATAVLIATTGVQTLSGIA